MLLAGVACTNTTLDLFDPDLGLLAHWALDESQAGSKAVDSSGFGNLGTPSPNPPLPTPDVPPVHFADGYSLSFNGQDQWLDLGNPPLLNIGGSTTMAAWIRATNIEGLRNVVAHGYMYNPSHDLALRIDSKTYQFTTWDAVNHAAVAPIPASQVGTWVHLCGVFDGSAYYIYVNGALADSTVDATMPPANINVTWTIGARAPQAAGVDPTTLDYPFQGQIDDVRIYGRALSAAEVEALYRR